MCVRPCARCVLYDPHAQLKTDKAQEIKKLNQQIQMVQSDMSKHREALEDCIRLSSNRSRWGSREDCGIGLRLSGVRCSSRK